MMTNMRHGCRQFAFVAVLVLGMTGGTWGRDFRIQDFIPKRFVDLRLQVRASGGYHHSSSSDDTPQDSTTPARAFDRHSSGGYGELGGSVAYTNTTIPQSLSAELSLTGMYTLSRARYWYASTGSNVGYDSTNSVSKSNRIGLSTYQRASLERYVRGDFFIAADVQGTLGFAPTDESENSSEEHKLSATYPGGYSFEELNSERTKITRSSANLSVSLSIMPGMGRLYEGSFAAKAMYMIDEFRKHGLLLREPSRDEMLQLTEIIYQNRLKHVIDSRTRLMESLEAVLEYCSSNGLVDQRRTMVSLLTNDVWSYFPKYSRPFGWKVWVGATLDGSHTKTTVTQYDSMRTLWLRYNQDSLGVRDTVNSTVGSQERRMTGRSSHLFPILAAKATYARPIDMKWQFQGTLEGKACPLAKFKTRDDHYNGAGTTVQQYMNQEVEYKDNYFVNLSVDLRKIVNSRTSYSVSGTLGYAASRKTTTSTSLLDGDSQVTKTVDPPFKRFMYSVVFYATYRISLPTALNLQLTYQSENAPSNWFSALSVEKRSHLSIGAGYTQFLF